MLSVLIVNWNTRGHLRACLDSLFRHPSSEPVEVIVVDNASEDGSAEMVANDFPTVRLIASDRNRGYASGNNAAFAVASGEWLLTLNPDTEVPEGALQNAVDALRAVPEFGALAPKLVGPDGRTQRSVRGFPSLTGMVGDLAGLARLFPRSAFGSYRLPDFDYEREGPAPQPMGTFLLYRREALAEVGDPAKPFDESFPIFFNEVDLLFRMNKAGWRCLYTPRVSVLHHGGASTRQVRPAMIWESHRSLLRFFRKHYRSTWNAPLFPLLSAIVLGAALIRARGVHAGFRA